MIRKNTFLWQLSILFSALVFICALSKSAYAAELISNVDRKTLSIEETLTLTVRFTGSGNNGEPNFSALENQFDILSRQQSSRFQNYNGNIQSFTDWVLVLAPTKEGNLLIPSFKLGNIYSEAVQIKVTPPEKSPMNVLQDVFLETIVDKSTSYVQEQIKISFRLYYSVNINAIDNEPLEPENVIIEALPDAEYRRTVNGKQYHIAEFSYALFPQTSGTLHIPALKWNLKTSRGSNSRSIFGQMGRYNIKRLSTEEKFINVKPKPREFPKDKTWIPAANVTLSDQWSKDPQSFKIGEPITRTITLAAEGLMSSQLPQLMNEAFSSEDIKIYPDQPKLDDEASTDGTSSRRSESFAVVVTRPGEVTLPGLKIPWWDVTENKLKLLELAPQIIYVASEPTTRKNQTASPLTNESNTQVIPENDDDADASNESVTTSALLWKILTALFAVLSLSFAFLLWRNSTTKLNREQTQDSIETNEREAFSRLKLACQSGDAAEIRRSLIQWSATYWKEESIVTLGDIANRIESKDIQNQFKALDAALFSPDTKTNWSAATFLSTLVNWRQKRKGSNGKQALIQPLYPSSAMDASD